MSTVVIPCGFCQGERCDWCDHLYPDVDVNPWRTKNWVVGIAYWAAVLVLVVLIVWGAGA